MGELGCFSLVFFLGGGALNKRFMYALHYGYSNLELYSYFGNIKCFNLIL
ncbi:hypothetical protein SAMN05878295_1035 [Aeromonas hydrophila]|nr:hypothetical protein SAMN05878295_1035 [Aeromonas hydrophila]SIQ61543.1 hypothetical protein SAMN05880569_1035 [Aeromonas hydrophila]